MENKKDIHAYQKESITKDEGLRGNEKIEETLQELRQSPSDEALAVVLTQIRKRMKEKGQFVVAVEPFPGSGMQIKTLKLKDGRIWIPVFTSFEEEMKGGNRVISTFLADIDQLLDMTLQNAEVDGLILNPWNLTITLNKEILRVIRG